MTPSLAERLRKAGIRHYDELIHDQPKEWAREELQGRRRSPGLPGQRVTAHVQSGLADKGARRRQANP